jgi:outer membrane biosynthesis protein TonB
LLDGEAVQNHAFAERRNERDSVMRSLAKTVAVIALGLFFAGAAVADTLELKDGRILQGRYLGGTQAVVRFEIDGDVRTFSVNDVVGVTFTGASGRSSAPAVATPADAAPQAVPPPAAAAPSEPPTPAPVEPAPPTAVAPTPAAAAPDTSAASAAPPADVSQPPVTSQDVPPPAAKPSPAAAQSPAAPQSPRAVQAAPAQDPAAQYGEVTIPAGQVLLVRMIDGVDSSKNQVGDVFHASLETDLYVNNTLLAHKGADIYGRLANVQEAGKLSGSAELQLELMRIVIDGHDYSLVSSDYSLKGQGRGADTAKKVSGGAIVGAIIGAIAGGGKGAAIGAGAGSAAGAGVQVFTKGEKVKVPSETLLEFRLQQPAMVTPTER